MQFKSIFIITSLAAIAIAAPTEFQARGDGGEHGGHGGGHGGGSGSSGGGTVDGNTCGNGQTLACCVQSDSSSGGLLGVGGILTGLGQCSRIYLPVGVLGSIIPLNPQSVCHSQIACCSGDVEQNGLINLNAPCLAAEL